MPIPIGQIGYEKMKKLNIQNPNELLKNNLSKQEYKIVTQNLQRYYVTDKQIDGK